MCAYSVLGIHLYAQFEIIRLNFALLVCAVQTDLV